MNSGNAKTPPADGAKSSGPSCAKDPSHARGAAPGLVSFVGAGPGDPELLTIKGRKAIEEASLVLYAGSLVPPDVVACAAPGVPVVDSAPLTLEQCHDLVRRTALAGGPVARVHTGDPSLYGALREQARLLDQDGIPWRVIPGVTAACAAAAAAGVTFTVPEVTQSLIITRMEGRTPVPEREALHLLAAHGTSWPFIFRPEPAKICRQSCWPTPRQTRPFYAPTAWAGPNSASSGPPPEPWPTAYTSTALCGRPFFWCCRVKTPLTPPRSCMRPISATATGSPIKTRASDF